jgi:hypothetical protein
VYEHERAEGIKIGQLSLLLVNLETLYESERLWLAASGNGL